MLQLGGLVQSSKLLAFTCTLIATECSFIRPAAGAATEQWVDARHAAHASENGLAQLMAALLGQTKSTRPATVQALDGKLGDMLTQMGAAAASASSKLQADAILQAVKQDFTGSLLLNELAGPSKRLIERLQQLGEIAVDIQHASEACGAYTFNPGGALVNSKWTGPSFTLTQTTGSCLVQPSFRGDGNTRWTRMQGRLACMGPGTQWAWKPLQYAGISHEPSSFTGPECKTEWKFGEESSITLYGGDSMKKITFASESDFYAAVTTNKTFDFHAKELRTALESLQQRISSSSSSGKGSLAGILAAAAAGNQAGKQRIGSTGTWRQLNNQQPAFQKAFDALAERLASGDVLAKGVGKSMFPQRM